MPCYAAKEMHHLLHPVQLDQMRVEQVERELHGDISMDRKVATYKSKCVKPMSHTQMDAEAKMQEECREIYRAKGLNEREQKEKFHQRQNMKKLQRQLVALPSMESTTAMGRNLVRRLHQQERTQKLRLISQKQPVVTQRDLERLKNAAKVVTVEQRLDLLVQQEKEEKHMQREYDRTRLRFKEMDDVRRRAAELRAEKEDLWGDEEKQRVLERAFLAKHEQEEEVKRVNQIILNAKCHAVRDAQIQEKSELQQELRTEDERLERLVNENAIKSISAEDDGVEKQREIRAQYAREIREQLSERETLRFLEAERTEHEAQLLRQANEAMKRDEEQEKALARERRIKIREELTRVLEMSNLFKKMLCEQEREADMRVAAYMKQKQERERALTTEKKVNKEAHERNQQRIYVLSQKILDSKSQREEMGYLREQERLEREYRRKEKEAAIRKKQLEQDLAASRELQLQETKHRQALQIAREEKDFNMLIDGLRRDEMKQKEKDENREESRRCYRTQIIRQMGDKELERRRLKEMELNQAKAWLESERQRNANIQSVINAKLQAMRDACLPEKYIRDVEAQLEKINQRKNRIV